VTNPPAAARPGTSFAVTDTVRNQGLLSAGASTTRYYLSTDALKGTGDRLLTGSRAVASLAPGAASTSTVTVTVPTATPPGTYLLLACADDLKVVVESDEGNNCLASAGAVLVVLPDLVEQSVSNPAGPFRPGTALTVSDTVLNDSPVSAAASTTKYYLSTDAVRNTGDVLLAGGRSVPSLGPSATSSGSASVTIPATTPPGTYVLLACADDTKVVVEGNESNNCRASGTAITVMLPDLVEQSVVNPGGPFRPGATFTVSDTVLNDSRVGTPASSSTRYYLSADTVRNTGDILLTGARTVPILGPSASSSASVAVTIPSTTLPGTYFLLACADDTKLVAESNEANNCRASGTALVVNP
jgi:subtilase family serine protease